MSAAIATRFGFQSPIGLRVTKARKRFLKARLRGAKARTPTPRSNRGRFEAVGATFNRAGPLGVAGRYESAALAEDDRIFDFRFGRTAASELKVPENSEDAGDYLRIWDVRSSVSSLADLPGGIDREEHVYGAR